MGTKKKPFYRIIATDSRMPRDGRFIETLGYYNPLPHPPVVEIKEQEIFKWLDRGAVPTESAGSVLRSVGCIQKWDLLKQGFTGEELERRVESIKSERAATVQRKDMKRKQVRAKKAQAKAAADESKAPAAAEAATAAPKEKAAPAAEAATAAPKEKAAPEGEAATPAPKVKAAPESAEKDKPEESSEKS
jgi:small subunit ribosomal protein S16